MTNTTILRDARLLDRLDFSLNVILALFSRYVVGRVIAAQANARLAGRLIAATTSLAAFPGGAFARR